MQGRVEEQVGTITDSQSVTQMLPVSCIVEQRPATSLQCSASGAVLRSRRCGRHPAKHTRHTARIDGKN